MNDEKYIELVKVALDSHKAVADKVAEVATLELPHNASPLVVLIHGDSQQLESIISYAENDDLLILISPRYPKSRYRRGNPLHVNGLLDAQSALRLGQ